MGRTDSFTRSLFNATFKTNPYLERAIMTGITTVSKESVFSDLNHLEVVTTTANKYTDCFGFTEEEVFGREEYELALTNKEVRFMFEYMIGGWFSDFSPAYNEFVKALLLCDVKAMNRYMNRVTLETFSFFDTGKRASLYTEPERFYHGFVLGLLVDLRKRYRIRSNRESGFGRYDVMLEPCNEGDLAYILEFKVFDPEEEESLQDTRKATLAQIGEKQYAAELLAVGIPAERVRKFGFAFEGKQVLIG